MNRLMTDADNKEDRHQNPRTNANFFEIHSFSWMFNLFKTGYSRDLNEKDLYKTLNDHSSSLLGNELEKIWKSEMINANKTNRKPSLFRALIKMFGAKFMLYGFLFCINELSFKLFQPIFFGELLEYFNSDDSNTTKFKYTYISALSFVLCKFIAITMHRSTQTDISHSGMKMRVACTSMIYRKALSLSQKSLSEITVGHVMNLLTNDVNRFDSSLLYIHYVWVGPMQTLIVTYYLWNEIGVLSLLGIATFLLFIPFQGWLGKKLSEQRSKIASKTDERIRLINEIISGIQLIKMYAWEKSFAQLIAHARKKEIQQIKRSSILKLILVIFKAIQIRIQLLIIILVYVTLGNYISARKVFVIISFYNLLQFSMSIAFVLSLESIAQLKVTVKRIQMFLSLEENRGLMRVFSETIQGVTNNDVIKKTEHSNNFSIEISNVSAKWTEIETNNALENINLIIESGRLVAVIGPVGAGKSSLMQLILSELPPSKGSISVRGVISYASQEPWVFAGSIKQNIIFISKMDEKRYKQVIEVCALKHDIEQFPNGDKTIVGERGVTLSGGQRARINLARAIYKQADIYLLDDPLSAVDPHVGKHLFENCIKNYLKGKICILITHQLQYLTSVDDIVLMENANISAKGSYQEVQASGFDFAKLLESSETNSNEPNNKVLNRTAGFNSTIGARHINSSNIVKIKQNEALAGSNEKAKLRSSKHVSERVYISYFNAGGSICKIIFFFFVFIFTQVLTTSGDYWLNIWVNQEEYVFGNKNTLSTDNRTSTTQDSSNIFILSINNRQNCVLIYTVIIFLMTLSILTRSWFCVSVCMKASLNLHNSVFKAIIKGTSFFFNTSSSGQIINRFSNDIGIIDDIIPALLSDTLHEFLQIFGIVFVVGLVNIYFMVPTFIIGIICYCLWNFYLPTSRNIKRLEGVTRSPVLTHMNMSLQGLTTIRAFQSEQMLTKEFDCHQDLHSSAYYLYFTSNLAFGLWIDLSLFIYISIMIFCFLILDRNSYKEYVGLTLTQIMSMAREVQWGMRQYNNLDYQMSSVERVLEYKKIPQEVENQSYQDKMPPAKWPDSGKILFQNFNLRYSPNSEYILKNLNFQIQPMEKIGIVGRTGAGKSSIINAIFRLALNEGNIMIDDINIQELRLNVLRSKLSIIPQEPVLFSGTIRKNLDPFDDNPDHVLWNALEEVQLKVMVENLTGGLNAKVSDHGTNFSMGQRQLVCLARAIIRNNKILVLDEATANVDQQTDSLIQKTIRNKFRKCTVLTIAHRLNTIIDSDRILVLDAGSIVEFDHPFNLLKYENGIFHKMVEDTGLDTAELLKRVASENFMNLQIKKGDIDDDMA